MNLLGLGRDQDIEKAYEYFSHPVMKGNAKALNAKGFIHFNAPEAMDQDPAKLRLYGSLRRDLKAAYADFKASASKGYINAKFNLGALYLSGLEFNLPKSESDKKLQFSFSKAYQHFMEAAEKGHTMGAYNIAIMHHVGLGTYQSCSVAKTFIEHVAKVGPHAQRLREAFKFANQGRILKATLMYMELAEMGFRSAILNSGLLLDKHNVFDSRLSYFVEDVVHLDGPSGSLDINRYLAFNFFKMGIHHSDIQSESMLKLGDYFFYGFQPLKDRNPVKAAQIYSWVEQKSTDEELRGQALFNLGMIYHFGSKPTNKSVSPGPNEIISVDLNTAQKFY